MAKKVARKSTARRSPAKKGLHHRIPAKHHDRVIVYGGLIAIALMLLISSSL
ncbi:MAG TPA: hypothetical protein PLD54_03230 [Candidatus Levybacteria bacterium]|nr:hypothetical protein [Candidatus Levybacteria bacterium]